jgi:hypothetical protein
MPLVQLHGANRKSSHSPLDLDRPRAIYGAKFLKVGFCRINTLV